MNADGPLAHHSSLIVHRFMSLLVCDDQPRSAVAAVDSKLRSDSQLGACGTEKRIDILSVTVVPKVVLDQNFDADLPLDHGDDYNKRSLAQSTMNL